MKIKEKTSDIMKKARARGHFDQRHLVYGIILEMDGGEQLWFEPITDVLDGIVLRDKDDGILRVWSVESLN